MVSLSLHPLHELRIAILERLGSLGMGEWEYGGLEKGMRKIKERDEENRNEE